MGDADPDSGFVTPASVDRKSGFEWRQLSAQVLEHRRTRSAADVNVTLEAAAEREPQSPLAGVYRFWMADNLARRGDLRASLGLYYDALDALAGNQPFVATIDGIGGALLQKAQTAALAGDRATAVEAYLHLARHAPGDPDP